MRFSYFLAPFLLLSALNAQAGQSEKEMLVGTWNHVRMEHVSDGELVRMQESHGDVQVVYALNGTWEFRSSQNRNSGTYNWLNDKSIESVIEKSDIDSQVGWRSTKQIEVNERFLKILTVYDEQAMMKLKPRAEGTRPKSMSVISVFERTSERSK
jgi:hypothetical protein